MTSEPLSAVETPEPKDARCRCLHLPHHDRGDRAAPCRYSLTEAEEVLFAQVRPLCADSREKHDWPEIADRQAVKIVLALAPVVARIRDEAVAAARAEWERDLYANPDLRMVMGYDLAHEEAQAAQRALVERIEAVAAEFDEVVGFRGVATRIRIELAALAADPSPSEERIAAEINRQLVANEPPVEGTPKRVRKPSEGGAEEREVIDALGATVYVTGDTADWRHEFAPGTEVIVIEDDYETDGGYDVQNATGESRWVAAQDLDVQRERNEAKAAQGEGDEYENEKCSCGHEYHQHDDESVPALCMVCGDSSGCDRWVLPVPPEELWKLGIRSEAEVKASIAIDEGDAPAARPETAREESDR